MYVWWFINIVLLVGGYFIRRHAIEIDSVENLTAGFLWLLGWTIIAIGIISSLSTLLVM